MPGAAFYDLYNDPREQQPGFVSFFPTLSAFNRMRIRHELWKERYPDRPTKHGPPFTGIENAREETKHLSEPPLDLDTLPFDPMEYVNFQLPWDGLDPD